MADTRVEQPDGAVDPAPMPAGGASSPPVTLGFAVGAIAVLVGVLIGIQPLRDNSFFTHLATGRLIFESGVPDADPYSYTAAGAPWTVQSWLASSVYRAVEVLGGFMGLRILMAATTGLLAAMVWRLTGRSQSLIIRLGLAGAVLMIGAEKWTERPLLFGLVGLAAVLLALDGRLRPVWIAPVMALWVNLHGSFPLGVLLIVLVVVGERLDGVVSRQTRDVGRWAALGLLVSMVNPIGPRLLLFPLEALDKREVFAQIREWQPVDLGEPLTWAFLVLVVVAGAAVLRRPHWATALPVVVFAGLGATSVRNVSTASLVLVAVAARELPAWGSLRTDGPAPRAMVPAIAVASALLAVSSLAGPDVNLKGYPVAAVDWLESQGVVGESADEGTNLVSRDFAGNYLEVRFGVDARVFIDDRYDMYPAELSLDYFDLLDGEDVAAIIDRYGADAVLWDHASDGADELLALEGWTVVHDDDEWFVTCRTRSSVCAGLGG